jgi:hypothetical protein
MTKIGKTLHSFSNLLRGKSFQPNFECKKLHPSIEKDAGFTI